MQRRFRVLACIAVAGPAAWGYVRWTTTEGVPLRRGDFANVRFAVGSRTAAGLMNREGGVIIAPDSDPLAALRAAAVSWSGASFSAVRFADLEITDAPESSGDRRNNIVFTDTPEHRSAVGGPNGAVAITMITYNPATGEILDSDIVFNPELRFSTTLAPGTHDIQSIAAHEMGHALGAGHTNVIWSTMYFTGPAANNVRAALSADEFAFLAEAYPAAEAAVRFGTIEGQVTMPGGAPVRGAFVTALNPTTGVHVSALTDSGGAYSIRGAPPGEYIVYAEPLDGPMFPEDVPIPTADVAFVTTAAGGFGSPSVVSAAGGGRSPASVRVTGGASSIDILRVGIGRAGGSGDAAYSSYGRTLQTGQAADLILWGPGIDAASSRIQLLGPGMAIRPGSVRFDPALPVIDGHRAVRMTVDVDRRTARSLVTILVTRDGHAAAHTGGLAILPAAAPAPEFTAAGLVNSASFTGGRFAPDSWADLYGRNLAAEFVIDGRLPESLGGTSISITDSQGARRAARLHFVSPERIQFLTPRELSRGTATLRVMNGGGGGGSGTATVEIAPVAPALFSANASGQGPAAATFLRVTAGGARTEDFTFTLDPPPNRANVPVGLGDAGDQVYFSLFGTGFRNNSSAVCSIGGVVVPVVGAVAQGQFAGLDQAVVGPVPRSLAGRGDASVVLRFDGIETNAVTLSFR
ncbi:MAG: carboxypeptidase regulatory-like domain-containing protein [Bryobacteraceae bacterium]|nr:carboxypeptidase regulatory-like domain-containing protein [Bryobacteraceae bacterium]